VLGYITTWIWNFGDPASGILNTSSLQNPDHQFSTTGTFWDKVPEKWYFQVIRAPLLNGRRDAADPGITLTVNGRQILQ